MKEQKKGAKPPQKHLSVPLAPDVTDVQCDHNAFAHHVFPYIVKHHDISALEELRTSPESACEYLSWIIQTTSKDFPPTEDRNVLSLKDISLSVCEIEKRPSVILRLTPPEHSIGCYFIALVAYTNPLDESQFQIRHFTLEKSWDSQTMICERIAHGDEDDSLSHRNHGEGPEPIEELFASRIADLLSYY